MKHGQILASDRLVLVENHEATEEGARAAPQAATASNTRTTGVTFMADLDVFSSRDRLAVGRLRRERRQLREALHAAPVGQVLPAV